MVTATRQTGLETTPKLYRVYYANDKPLQLEWIAQGTDSNLYVVSAIPGGWLRRSRYHGQVEKLKAVSQEKARCICWTVYGDVGSVTMAGVNAKSLA
jgi:hypothetical protein